MDFYINKDMPIENKVKLAKELMDRNINSNILENSILLIGPMGTGKSTLADKISQDTGLKRISLDDEKLLRGFYNNREKFEYFKDFELYLVLDVLTSLQDAAVIDFGAGHSVQENPVMFEILKEVVEKFKNVDLILPSENINESIEILDEIIKKRNIREEDKENALRTNRHFLNHPSNYVLATNTFYTKGKSVEETAENIINVAYKKDNFKKI